MAYTYPIAPVNAVFLTTMRYSFVAQRLMNTFTWKLEANSTNLTVDAVANAMNVFFAGAGGLYAKLDILRDNNCVMDDIQIQMIYPNRYAASGFPRGAAGTSPDSTPMDMIHTTGVVTFRSVEATRRGVSNKHLPLAAGTTYILAGVLTNACKTALSDVGNSVLGTAAIGSGVTLSPVIYHRGVTPVTSKIESFLVNPQVRTMRRRTVGVGI